MRKIQELEEDAVGIVSLLPKKAEFFKSFHSQKLRWEKKKHFDKVKAHIVSIFLKPDGLFRS